MRPAFVRGMLLHNAGNGGVAPVSAHEMPEAPAGCLLGEQNPFSPLLPLQLGQPKLSPGIVKYPAEGQSPCLRTIGKGPNFSSRCHGCYLPLPLTTPACHCSRACASPSLSLSPGDLCQGPGCGTCCLDSSLLSCGPRCCVHRPHCPPLPGRQLFLSSDLFSPSF